MATFSHSNKRNLYAKCWILHKNAIFIRVACPFLGVEIHFFKSLSFSLCFFSASHCFSRIFRKNFFHIFFTFKYVLALLASHFMCLFCHFMCLFRLLFDLVSHLPSFQLSIFSNTFKIRFYHLLVTSLLYSAVKNAEGCHRFASLSRAHTDTSTCITYD